MTCPRCARDLLLIANDAIARGDLISAIQPIREAITEWDHPGEAQALTGEMKRLERYGTVPSIGYWLIIAERRLNGPTIPHSAATPNTQTFAPVPCGHCPQS
jgi:hypothetical protein